MSYLPREERRRSIVEAAAQVIASDGIAGVNSRSVSAALDGSPGQIHHHFASIDELTAEAWEQYTANEVRRFRELTSRMSREEKLRAFFAELLDSPQEGTSLRRWAEASTYSRVRTDFAPAYVTTLETLLVVLEECLVEEPRESAARLLVIALGLAGLTSGSAEQLGFSRSALMSSAIADSVAAGSGGGADGPESESWALVGEGGRLRPLSERVPVPSELSFPSTDHGVVWRELRRSDLPALLALKWDAAAVDDPESVTDLEDLEESFDAPGFDPARDSVIAVDAQGRIVAHGEAYLEASGDAVVTVHVNGQVHPDWRRRGIGTAVLRWQTHRATQQLAGSELRLPGMLSTLVSAQAEGQRALFEREGFAPVRWWIGMERDLAEPVLEVVLDAGLRIERYAPHWSEPARGVINEAFRDHWGSQPTSREEWEAARQSSDFRSELSVVAVAALPNGTEQVVGALTVEADEEEWAAHGYRFGDVDELGVLRAWRGQGIARAMLAHAMRAMRAAGMERASLDVDSDSPTGARSLYESLGFRETERSVTYAKTYA